MEQEVDTLAFALVLRRTAGLFPRQKAEKGFETGLCHSPRWHNTWINPLSFYTNICLMRLAFVVKGSWASVFRSVTEAGLGMEYTITSNSLKSVLIKEPNESRTSAVKPQSTWCFCLRSSVLLFTVRLSCTILFKIISHITLSQLSKSCLCFHISPSDKLFHTCMVFLLDSGNKVKLPQNKDFVSVCVCVCVCVCLALTRQQVITSFLSFF